MTDFEHVIDSAVRAALSGDQSSIKDALAINDFDRCIAALRDCWSV